MSVLISGLCYQIKFGCPKRKAVAVALGDHAADDGTHVWPAIKRLALKVEWSERTVQRVLRELEAIGLLVVVSEGGSGPKDTREWAFNLDMLKGLADGRLTIEAVKEEATDEKKEQSSSDVATGDQQTPLEGDQQTPLEGDQQTPLTDLRVSTVQLRVTGSTPKGDSAVTRIVTNRQEPSRAPERARGFGLDLKKTKPRASFVLSPSDIQWSAWMEHLKRLHRDDLVETARDAGTMSVPSRWPTGDELPNIPGGKARAAAAVAKRIIGEPV